MTTPAPSPILKAPFPWFGGKRRAAHLVWPRFGPVPNYSEPFAGSLANLLNRPSQPGNEIVNDLDCYIANAWRAMRFAPDQVAQYCDWPVNEADLHARHRWLHSRLEFRHRMEHDPDYFDPRIAGFYIWGLSCWIGDNFCRPTPQAATPQAATPQAATPKMSGDGGVCRKIPVQTPRTSVSQSVSRKIPYLNTGGTGVSRKVPHLTGGKGDEAASSASDQPSPQCREKKPPGYWRTRPHITDNRGANTNTERKRPDLYSWKGLDQLENLQAWFAALSARLRFVKVCCGDWARVCTKAATYGQGLTGVFLDPPYDPDTAGCDTVYGDLHPAGLSGAVREWALENGSNPLMRIALCGYEGEHEMPPDWECIPWKASGGYAAAAGNHENSKRERIWFSPHCLKPHTEPELFKL